MALGGIIICSIDGIMARLCPYFPTPNQPQALSTYIVHRIGMSQKWSPAPELYHRSLLHISAVGLVAWSYTHTGIQAHHSYTWFYPHQMFDSWVLCLTIRYLGYSLRDTSSYNNQ
ncbi:hypothetical protein BGZ63DRAFT_384125 [Mariannaea sp. PMI_226]|nr:hypothetical protein BGZ63DRAFT_384125 [Mariannaea sp. PMI_226]